MKEELLPVIIEQTKILYANIEETLNTIEESQLYNAGICDWPPGEQIYHMLHSLDQWFINPNRYEEPEIASLLTQKGEVLSKPELTDYYNSIKAKITDYLENLDTESLSEKPPDCRFTRLALILGQYRHLMYHIGLIHGCLRIHTGGKSPAYFGLGPPIKPVARGG